MNDLFLTAAKKGYLKGVQSMISLGADIHYKDDSAFKYAARNGHLKVVKLLISLGVDNNMSAFYCAAVRGHLKIVKLLISLGIDDYNKQKVLEDAIYYNKIEVVKVLLSSGANLTEKILKTAAECMFVHPDTYTFLIGEKQKHFFKGPINDQTETECGICLIEMNTEQEIVQCKTCKKCVHYKCNNKWTGNSCIYCRNVNKKIE